jgi:phosphatidylglycerol:prolipoprotein diacylglycerol transferase
LGVFPYLQIPLLHLGPYSFGVFRILVVTGILVGYFTMLRLARRAGLDRGDAAELCLWAIVCGLLGAHWFKLAYQPVMLRRDPLILIQVFNGMASFGGLAGGLIGAAIFFRRRRMPAVTVLRYLDLLAFVFLCGMLFGRLGCYTAHDHPGIRTSSWLGVQYPKGSRYDLGLLEALLIPFFLVPFRVVNRLRIPGLYVGAVLILYPCARLCLDLLHERPPRYWGISVDQYASFACILAGFAILRLAFRKPGLVTSSLPAASNRAW